MGTNLLTDIAPKTQMKICIRMFTVKKIIIYKNQISDSLKNPSEFKICEQSSYGLLLQLWFAKPFNI